MVYWNDKCVGILDKSTKNGDHIALQTIYEDGVAIEHRQDGKKLQPPPPRYSPNDMPRVGDTVMVGTVAKYGQLARVTKLDYKNSRVHVRWLRGDGQEGRKSDYNATSLLRVNEVPSPKTGYINVNVKIDDELKKVLSDLQESVDDILLPPVVASDDDGPIEVYDGTTPWVGVNEDSQVQINKRDIRAFDDELEVIWSKINKIEKDVVDLDNRKITKPSLSPEMLDAERYMDDFDEIRKKYRVQRFAQKQRTKRKLARIEKAAEFTKKKPNRTKAVLAIAILTILGFAIQAFA
jgi:hypothetical protein